MSKPPSAATLLRNANSKVRDLQRQLIFIKAELERFRGRTTKAEIEAADWRKRFDLLLARSPNDSSEVRT